MRCSSWKFFGPAALAGMLFGSASVAFAADPPSPKLALSFQPVQKKFVVFDTPTGADVDKCQVKVERRGQSSGWVVYGPEGQVLRRFSDSNADNVVDTWQYYHQGIEVYRDLDTNNNNKVDQSRWLNTAGTRWGLDTNEDGQIDEWKVISAEEASRLAVEAMIAGDAKLLETLLINAKDIKTLGIEDSVAKDLLDSVADASGKVKKITSGSKVLNSRTRWMRFDSANPGVIPADEGKSSQDLMVYENAMGIVDVQEQAGLVQLGELVRVGDTWKLTQIPMPLEGESPQVAATGILLQPAVGMTSSPSAVPSDVSPEAQKLLEQLQELDANAPTPTSSAKVLADYNKKRADLLAELTKAARDDKEREQWTKQLIDGLTAAVQTGQFPEGLERLKAIEAAERKKEKNDDMIAYVSFRVLMSQYATSLQQPQLTNEQRQELQTWWLAQLKTFATKYPTAQETAEALFQLAMAQEFAGKIDEATQWYDQLVRTHRQTEAGARATGALRRLGLQGKKLELAGAGFGGGSVDVSSYEGRVVLVIFWSTWCKPCTEDLPQIISLYNQYRAKGFEVLGVNLDNATELVQPYITEHKVPWPHIHEPGGLDSGPGKAFGIISLPTMFLVDKTGTVISRSTSVQELKDELPKLLK
jgi:thiol-disulfide isomerase/thioredoxin